MRDEIAKIEALSYYAKKFQRLRVDRAHGIAPHKPILLLSVIEQIRRETITENKIYLSSELIQTFLKYWSYLGSFNHNPDISRPFFHMRSGKFWHLWANSDYIKLLSSKEKLKTLVEFNNTPDSFLNGSTRLSGLAVPGSSHFIKVSFASDIDKMIPFTVESGFEA